MPWGGPLTRGRAFENHDCAPTNPNTFPSSPCALQESDEHVAQERTDDRDARVPDPDVNRAAALALKMKREPSERAAGAAERRADEPRVDRQDAPKREERRR